MSVLSQAAIGSGYNFVSEFSLDILRAFGIKKYGSAVLTNKTPRQ